MYLNNRAQMFNLIYFFRVSKSTWYVQMGLSYCHLMDAITQQPPASTESNAFKMIHSQATSAGPSAERSYRTIVLGQVGLLLGEEDTGHVTIENHLTNLLFLMFSSFFCPFVLYCFTSTMSSTPSKSHKLSHSWRTIATK